jgi:hypothetical protein
VTDDTNRFFYAHSLYAILTIARQYTNIIHPSSIAVLSYFIHGGLRLPVMDELESRESEAFGGELGRGSPNRERGNSTNSTGGRNSSEPEPLDRLCSLPSRFLASALQSLSNSVSISYNLHSFVPAVLYSIIYMSRTEMTCSQS